MLSSVAETLGDEWESAESSGEGLADHHLVHDTGATIHYDKQAEAILFMCPTTDLYEFPASDLERDEIDTLVRTLATDFVAALDQAADGGDRVYAVVNPKRTERPINFCREGADNAVFRELQRAVISRHRLSHHSGNPCLEVIELTPHRDNEMVDLKLPTDTQ